MYQLWKSCQWAVCYTTTLKAFNAGLYPKWHHEIRAQFWDVPFYAIKLIQGPEWFEINPFR
jgi:hypothetical protein